MNEFSSLDVMKNLAHIFISFCLLGLFLVSAEVVVDHGFSSGEGFVAGELRFQMEWLGQEGAIVKPDGNGLLIGTGAYMRNLHRRGALGSLAGSPFDGEGSGSRVGDRFRIVMEYKIMLTSSQSTALNQTGVRHNYSNGSYEAGPLGGFKVGYERYHQDNGGSLKFFSNLSRNMKSADENMYALIIQGKTLGLDPSRAQPDLVSDSLLVTFAAEMIDSETWKTTEFKVYNVDTQTLCADGSDRPNAMEKFSLPGSELYLASRWVDSELAEIGVKHILFEYFSGDSQRVAPEPVLLR